MASRYFLKPIHVDIDRLSTGTGTRKDSTSMRVTTRRSVTTSGLVVSGLAVLMLALAAISAIVFQHPTTGHASASDFYVAPNGNDGNPCTQSLPCFTITRAAKLVQPGGTVHAAPGTYTYSSSIYTSSNGTVTAPITYISDTPRAAKIVVTGAPLAWYNGGNYVRIVGFDMTDTNGSNNQGLDNYGSHTLASGNYIHDIATWGCPSYGAGINDANFEAVDVTEQQNLVVRVGPPGGSNCGGTHGIYHANTNGRVQNNIVAAVSGFCVKVGHNASNDLVVNNTLVNCGFGGIYIGSYGTNSASVPFPPASGDHINNNIITNSGTATGAKPLAISIEDSASTNNSLSFSHNLFWANASNTIRFSSGNGTQTGTVVANPLLASGALNGTGDYHVLSGSPAIGHGTPQYAPSQDFSGVSRPQKQGYDIGAYESTSSTQKSIQVTNAPCTVRVHGTMQPGTCTGTFTP